MSEHRILIKVGKAVTVDPERIAAAVAEALSEENPEKAWRINDVPALAQLEEGIYTEGRDDLALSLDSLLHSLDLPADQITRAVVEKSLRRLYPNHFQE